MLKQYFEDGCCNSWLAQCIYFCALHWDQILCSWKMYSAYQYPCRYECMLSLLGCIVLNKVLMDIRLVGFMWNSVLNPYCPQLTFCSLTFKQNNFFTLSVILCSPSYPFSKVLVSNGGGAQQQSSQSFEKQFLWKIYFPTWTFVAVEFDVCLTCFMCHFETVKYNLCIWQHH